MVEEEDDLEAIDRVGLILGSEVVLSGGASTVALVLVIPVESICWVFGWRSLE